MIVGKFENSMYGIKITLCILLAAQILQWKTCHSCDAYVVVLNSSLF